MHSLEAIHTRICIQCSVIWRIFKYEDIMYLLNTAWCTDSSLQDFYRLAGKMLPGVGIFGTGNIVKIIVPFLKQKGFKVEALWGRTLLKAEQTAQELDIPFYTNKIDNVLLRKDVDLIFIMCSPNLQAQIAVKALGIGKHVVCDKPAGLDQSEAIKMVHAAQYYPSLISIINHSLRFLPAFTHMKKAISEGVVGPESDITACDIRLQMGCLYLSQYNWLCDRTMGGGVLTLVGSHVIDLISYLINQRAVRVHGIVKTFQETSDTINGIRHITSPDFCSFQMEMTGTSHCFLQIHRLRVCIWINVDQAWLHTLLPHPKESTFFQSLFMGQKV